MRTFLVTGGAGFIGSHLVEALVQRGDRVRVLDNLSTGFLANLEGVRDQIEFIRGDLVDGPTVGRAVEGVDTVFHQAALASVPRSVEQPASDPCGLRHRDAHAPGRRPAGRSAAGGLRRFQQRLWRPAQPEQARDRLAGPHLPLRRRQAGRRILRPGLLGHLRPADRYAPLFQRFRAPAGPGQPLFGRDPPVHHGPVGRPAAGGLRRRAAVARLHLRGQRGPGQPAGRRRPRRRRPGIERRQWPVDLALGTAGRDQRPAGHEGRPPLRAAPSGRHPRKHGRHHARPHAAAVRAAGRLPRGPAAIDRLLPPPGAGASEIMVAH